MFKDFYKMFRILAKFESMLENIFVFNYIFFFIIFVFFFFLQREHLKIAQQYFQLVGGSASECGMYSFLEKESLCVLFLCILQLSSYCMILVFLKLHIILNEQWYAFLPFPVSFVIIDV